MSDLRTLFISQSYTSLIHTSNDGAVPTGSYIELQDGSGNNLGIEVNRNGNFNIQGELSASSVNGIGNVTTYSASVDNRLDQLETDTGSQDNRLDLLEEFTSSQEQINLIVNNFTSSQEDKNTTLETVTSSLQQSVDSLEVFTASLETNFVTSASFQAYTSSTDNRLDNIETTTASLETSLTNLNSYTSSTDNRLDSIETTTASLQTQIDNIDTGSLLETASFDNGTRNITFTKADASTFNVNIPGADITPLNDFTASQLTINSGYNTFTESADNRLNNIEGETGSYARTDVANIFTGSNNTFPMQFDLRPTNSAPNDDSRFRFDSFQNRIQISLISDDTFNDREIRFYPSSSYQFGYPTDSELGLSIKEDAVLAYGNTLGITSNGFNKLGTFEISGSDDGDSYVTYLGDTKVMEYNWDSDFIIHNNINARGGIDAQGRSTFFGGMEVIDGFTASLQEGNFFVGNGTNKTTQFSTSSLLADSATLSGDNTFDGNQTISGSVNGNVEVITITSSTASIDCSTSNFFTVTLPTGSTHFTATNITPGQTVSLRVASQFGATVSIDESTVKFPIGQEYTPSVSASFDLLTFVSFDTNSLFGVGTNLYSQ